MKEGLRCYVPCWGPSHLAFPSKYYAEARAGSACCQGWFPAEDFKYLIFCRLVEILRLPLASLRGPVRPSGDQLVNKVVSKGTQGQ